MKRKDIGFRQLGSRPAAAASPGRRRLPFPGEEPSPRTCVTLDEVDADLIAGEIAIRRGDLTGALAATEDAWRRREHEIPLEEGENVLGREPGTAGSIPDASISRRHARITVRGDEATLEDLDSKNGTFVGEERLTQPAPLSDGDSIRLGLVRLIFRAPPGSLSTTKTVR